MLPSRYEKLRPAAEELLARRRGDVVFSRATYQVQVYDPEAVWVFLQLGRRGVPVDGFCGCGDGTVATPCVHMAAALIQLYNSHDLPLHERFNSSFWHNLTELFACLSGYRALKRSDDIFIFDNDQFYFEIRATTGAQATLAAAAIHRKKEDEDSSIKFSGLDDDELDRWREGNPSPALQYELSAWGELGKLCMLQQEGGAACQLEVMHDGEHFTLIATAGDYTIHAKVGVQAMASLVPALTTVSSNAIVTLGGKAGMSAVYEPTHGQIQIVVDQSARSVDGTVQLEEWLYFPSENLFQKQGEIGLSPGIIPQEEVEQALDLHGATLNDLLQDLRVHRSARTLSYTLYFDDSWTLHIDSYFNRPGDLASPSQLFGRWLYVDGKGFWPVEGHEFEGLHLRVSVEDVSAFVDAHRNWLNLQEGFGIRLAELSEGLQYTVDEEGNIHFYGPDAQRGERMHDFGGWIYIEGGGFYPRKRRGSLLQAGMTVEQREVPTFLRIHRQDLEEVSGFFSEHCPIEDAGLQIDVVDQGIEICAQYRHKPEYADRDVRVFGDYAYVEGEGFSELPGPCRLPERFHERYRIDGRGLTTFLSYELDLLRSRAWQVDNRLKISDKLSLQVSTLERAGDMWILSGAYASASGEVSLAVLREAVDKRKRYLFSDAGLIDLQHPRLRWLKTLPSDRWEQEAVSLTAIELLRLDALDALQGDEEVLTPLRQLEELETATVPRASLLTSPLRSYQEKGLQWLWFLHSHGLSGLLCDDMGLGKTHQAMALMAAMRETNSTARFLVICPTSVLYHWKDKLAQHLPQLTVCVYHGARREVVETENVDVVVTSYGIWRRDQHHLEEQRFALAIYDEVQLAKNRNTRIYSALRRVSAGMRLGLTGTPIENRLTELKALFDLVLPGYFPVDADYQRQFVKPIEHGDEASKEKLSRLIRPFVLRRIKTEVLDDLPEKTEEVAHCELTDQQRELYQQVLTGAQTKVVADLENEQTPVPYVHVFAILGALKQICDHPAVYLKDVENYQAYTSGKWELFCELLEEARASKQKVVVFSQYLAMLDIMELHLRETGVRYASVRGATVNRHEQIRRFNEDPDCEVFLASLQAVGLGVDLTAGSVVIHYDRWWNAAREDQATDRVHRIGQQRGVQVFKMVTVESFEERIDQMIADKGKLLEEVVGTDDQQVLKLLDREELLALLRPSE